MLRAQLCDSTKKLRNDWSGSRAGGVEQKRKAGEAGSRAGGVEQKRKANQAGGVAQKRQAGQTSGTSRAAESGRRRGYGDQDVLQQGTKAPLARFAHIVNRIACVVGKSVKDALAPRVGTADKPKSLYSRRLLNQDLDAGYIRIEHPASNGASDEFDDNVRASLMTFLMKTTAARGMSPSTSQAWHATTSPIETDTWPTLRPTSTRRVVTTWQSTTCRMATAR